MDLEIFKLEHLPSDHMVIIVSNGKVRKLQLPAYGKVSISCHDKQVRTVKKETDSKF